MLFERLLYALSGYLNVLLAGLIVVLITVQSTVGKLVRSHSENELRNVDEAYAALRNASGEVTYVAAISAGAMISAPRYPAAV